LVVIPQLALWSSFRSSFLWLSFRSEAEESAVAFACGLAILDTQRLLFRRYAGCALDRDGVPGRGEEERGGLCVVRAKPIAHPKAHKELDENVDHTDLMQGLHVLTR
jgi:hypothetical protein